MVSLLSTKFHEILFSSFRGVELTNCVTDRTKTICLPTKMGRDIIIILYWINNLNFVWMLNQNQYLRIKWQASVMSSLMTNMLFLQTRLQITWYLIVKKTHAFGCHNQWKIVIFKISSNPASKTTRERCIAGFSTCLTREISATDKKYCLQSKKDYNHTLINFIYVVTLIKCR